MVHNIKCNHKLIFKNIPCHSLINKKRKIIANCCAVRGTYCYCKIMNFGVFSEPHTPVTVYFLLKCPISIICLSSSARVSNIEKLFFFTCENNIHFEESLCFSQFFSILCWTSGLLKSFRCAQIKEITQPFADVQGRNNVGFMPYEAWAGHDLGSIS